MHALIKKRRFWVPTFDIILMLLHDASVQQEDVQAYIMRFFQVLSALIGSCHAGLQYNRLGPKLVGNVTILDALYVSLQGKIRET